MQHVNRVLCKRNERIVEFNHSLLYLGCRKVWPFLEANLPSLPPMLPSLHVDPREPLYRLVAIHENLIFLSI
jgi:hypothetical protein